MTFTANSGFAQDDIYGNWGLSDVVVKYHDAEHGMVAYIERINMSDANSRFYKQINSTMVAGQTYVVEFDILISANYNGNFYVQVVSWPTQQDAYGFNGVQAVMSSTEWTHIRQEFTLSNDFTSGPNELVFWMWEGSQGDYVLIDNIKLTTVDGTSVDTLGDGGFDSFFEYTPYNGEVILPKQN